MVKLTRIGMPEALFKLVKEYAENRDISISEAIKRLVLVGDLTKTEFEELGRSIDMYNSENHEGVGEDEHDVHVTTHSVLESVFEKIKEFDWTESLSLDVEFKPTVIARFKQIAKEEGEGMRNVIALRVYLGWLLIMRLSVIQDEHARVKLNGPNEIRLGKFLKYCNKRIIEPCMP